MSNQVYANGREISCKAADGKSICAFPDVCLSPPSPPAGPVPIPYPNTGMASDTDGGSKTVQISGKEVMLKDSSSFKKSTGDEAATKSLGMGVVTHQIQGKVYFTSWSMDVMIEGENAVRHLDLMTHNHASIPGNTPTWPYIDQAAMPRGGPCSKEKKKEEKACRGCKTEEEKCKKKSCAKARKCMLVPFSAPKETHPNAPRCCPGKTGHHLIPVQEFCYPGKPRGRTRPGNSGYQENMAPCMCLEGEVHNEWQDTPPYALKEHGICGNAYNAEFTGVKSGSPITYEAARNAGVESAKAVSKPQCRPGCMQQQLDNYHKDEAKVSDNLVKSEQHTYAEHRPPARTRSR